MMVRFLHQSFIFKAVILLLIIAACFVFNDVNKVEAQVGTPAAPQNFRAVIGDGYVTLFWEPPTNIGGSAITGYSLSRQLVSGRPCSDFRTISNLDTAHYSHSDTSNTLYYDEDIANGRTAYFCVRARNSSGFGDWSNNDVPISATPQSPTIPTDGNAAIVFGVGTYNNPYIISNPETISSGSGLPLNDRISSLHTHGMSGRPIFREGRTNIYENDDNFRSVATFFKFTRESSSSNYWNIKIDTTPNEINFDLSNNAKSVRSISDNGDETYLSNGTDHNFAVFRHNNSTDRAASATQGLTSLALTLDPQSINAPGAPTNFRATPRDEAVHLSWRAPTVHDQGPVTRYEYKVYNVTDSREVSGKTGWNNTNSTGTSVVVGDLTNDKNYRFNVRATNIAGVGPESISIEATPIDYGDAGSDIIPTLVLDEITIYNDTDLILTWSPPRTSLEITGYEYTTNIERDRWLPTNNIETTYRVTGLTRGETYTFWVRAIAGDVKGIASNSVTGGLTSVNTPKKIANLCVIEDNDTPDDKSDDTCMDTTQIARSLENSNFLTLGWNMPGRNDAPGGFQVTGYEYIVNERSWASTNRGTENRVDITRLEKGRVYDFWVRAVNANGSGVASDRLRVIIPAETGVPDDIDDLDFDDPENKEVVLYWTAPDANSSPITDYQYTSNLASGNWTFIGRAGGGPKKDVNGVSFVSVTITGLTSNTSYTYWVRAVNDAGPGPASNSVSFRVEGTVSGKPKEFTTTTIGNGGVDVSWKAPDDDGGSPILRYELQTGEYTSSDSTPAVSDANGNWTTIDVANTFHTITGLDNSKYYAIFIRAINGNEVSGDSSKQAEIEIAINHIASTTSTPITLNTNAPEQVEGLEASAADRRVILKWRKPNSDRTITGYEFTSDNINWNSAGDKETYTIRNLTNGREYFFRVRAVNSNKDIEPTPLSIIELRSIASESVIVIPNVVQVFAVRNLQASAGDGSIRLVWDPPDITDNSTVNNYQIKINDKQWENIDNSDLDSVDTANGVSIGYTVDELDGSPLVNNRRYAIGIRAVTDLGEGIPVTIYSSPQASVPGQVTGLSADIVGNNIRLSWNEPIYDGGLAITGYLYTMDGITWLPTSGTGTTENIPFTIDNYGETYDLQVRAVNDEGWGVPSSVYSIIPTRSPDPPTNLTGTAGKLSVSLSWSAPANNGGSAISGYRYNINGGTFIDIPQSSGLSYTVKENLTHGVLYSFSVVALNSNGASDPSNTVTLRPLAEGEVASSSEESETVKPHPLNDSENEFVRTICWRIPGCPASVLFIAPVVSVVAVFAAGGRHPALLLFIGGGMFGLFLVLLLPNIFTFLFVGAVGVCTLLLWKFLR